MNLTLKPETEKIIQERIERGEYKDAAELVDEAWVQRSQELT